MIGYFLIIIGILLILVGLAGIIFLAMGRFSKELKEFLYMVKPLPKTKGKAEIIDPTDIEKAIDNGKDISQII